MDLDQSNQPPDRSNVTLVMLVDEWLVREMLTDFSITYPRDGDTTMVGYEGSIRYNHHNEGYATVVSIYGKYAYTEYDSTVIEASDPDFFTKLKTVLLRHKTTHANCKHMRSFND